MKISIDIDTEKLSVELEKLREVKSNLDEIFSNVEKDTTALKDIWSSKTSEDVQESFLSYYKIVEKTKNNIASDIAFLETTLQKHEKELANENKTIDERIALR